MSLAQLGRTSTPITLADAATQLRSAVASILPAANNTPALELLLALIWVESGRGNAIQYNYGNLAAGGYTNGVEHIWHEPFWRPDWYENESNPTHARMLAGQAPSAFQAFGDSQEGMQAFVKLLAGSTYSGLISAARSGSVEAFVQALHDSGYSKDYNQSHVPTFRSIVADIRSAHVLPATQTTTGSASGLLLFCIPAAVAIAIFAAVVGSRRPGEKRS